MAKLSVALLTAICFANDALAEWQIVSSSSESGAAQGAEHRHITYRDLDASADATIDLALFSPATVALRVIDNSRRDKTSAEAMTSGNCVAGVNGGYFDPHFQPIGLRVIEGVVASPLTRARLLTGVVCSSVRGITILRLAEFSGGKKYDAAIECGPFLVDAGTRVGTLDGKRRARRTFAAVSRAGKAALGVSSDLTLAQLGALLADNRSLANDFKIWRALNLDGGSSSAFWFKKNNGAVFSISEDKSVRDFVGVAEKDQAPSTKLQKNSGPQ